MTRRGSAGSGSIRNTLGCRWHDLLRAALLSGGARATWAASLYAGPATDPAFVIMAPRLLNTLYPEQRLNAVAVADDTAALDRVLVDPASAALADLATMQALVTSRKLAADRLEFHGPLEQRCLLAFARRDGWVHAFADITSANGTPRPTVGLAGPGADTLLGLLRRTEPGLTNVDTQPGDATVLAAQVARGAPDVLLLAAYPELDHDLIHRLADDDRLTPLPVVTRLLSREALDRDSGFTMTIVHTDNDLVPWDRRTLTTLCSPVGVVLRGDAQAALRDTVNRAVPVVAASLKMSLVDRAKTATTNTYHDTLDAVQGLITRLRGN
jgi:hypothetical protein